MKRICTLFIAFFALATTQNSYAQLTGTCTASSTFLTPSSFGYGPMDSVKASNGYSSTNTTNFNVFPKGVAAQSTTITSPALQYPMDQSSVYFKFNFDIANNPNGSSACNGTVVIKYGSTTVTATNVNFTITNGGGDYYFRFDFPSGQQLPANVPFSISLTLDIPNNEKAVTGYTFSSNAPVSSHAVLPVKFTGFNARKTNNAVLLYWMVGTQENVEGYEIEKSMDAASFSKIGFVSAGNSSSYNFTDSKSTGNAYYRIRSVDINSKYTYSTVISVQGQQSSVIMKAFPMPVQNQLTVQHNTAADNGRIEILSVDGRMIKSVSLASGAQQTAVDLSAAKAGVYVVRFVNDNIIESLKIVKQ